MRSSALSALIGAFVISILAACSLPTTTVAPSKPGLDCRRPEIIGAELLTGDHLRLRFSEPLAPIEGVDPNDFRLSLGLTESRNYTPAYHYEPARYYAFPRDSASYLDLGDYMHLVDAVDGDRGLLRLSGMAGQADTLDLHLDPDFDLAECRGLTSESPNERGRRAEGGLFLHYSPGERPITDEAGNELAGIGAEWVRLGRSGDDDDAVGMYFRGRSARRALRGLIPIECGPIPVERSSGP